MEPQPLLHREGGDPVTLCAETASGLDCLWALWPSGLGKPHRETHSAEGIVDGVFTPPPIGQNCREVAQWSSSPAPRVAGLTRQEQSRIPRVLCPQIQMLFAEWSIPVHRSLPLLVWTPACRLSPRVAPSSLCCLFWEQVAPQRPLFLLDPPRPLGCVTVVLFLPSCFASWLSLAGCHSMVPLSSFFSPDFTQATLGETGSSLGLWGLLCL